MEKKNRKVEGEKAHLPADPGATPATDPQENMQGPVSSVMQKIKEGAKKNDDKEQEEHEHKKSHTGGDFLNK